MKKTSLLLFLSVCFGLASFAQQANTSVTTTQQDKRITITTTKTDENGKTVTRTWIAEGNEPAEILQGMVIDPDVLKEVDIAKLEEGDNKERLFLFRRAGDQEGVEGVLHEGVAPADESIVIINERWGDDSPMVCRKIHTIHHGNKAFGDRKTNCAALGVYVSTSGKADNGTYINSLIKNGGAGEAGIQAGDIIQKIDEFDVMDYSTLHLALSHFRPGDQVTVGYEREGQKYTTSVNLKDWAELPGHEFRSRSDCKEEEPVKQEDNEPLLLDEPTNTVEVLPLELEDARIFPNPTDGVFALSFTTLPGPLTVSVSDPTGKVVFQEENQNVSGAYNRDIDLTDLPQGNYILNVRQGDKIYSQQIAKQ